MNFADIRIFQNSSDFSLENRHIICIANKEYLNKNIALLFYKKSDRKDKPIYEVFTKVGNSLKLVNLNFISCPVDSIPGFEKKFHEIASDSDHPYNWIKNKPKNEEKDSDTSLIKFPFILMYRKGFPQGFYEGPIDEKSFREYCIQFSVKTDNCQYFSTDSYEIVKQQWVEYRIKDTEDLKSKPVIDALNMADCSNKLSMQSFLPISPKK